MPTRAEKLQKARGLILEVLQTMDVGGHLCPTCQCNRWHNFNEKKDAEVLEGIERKLKGIAGKYQ